tara:strand:+ start:717 stop:1271 length:555 start_codon:yes stop_codon:yes gene_type:complete
MFEAPIPGQSLTTEPRNTPWENPSEMSKVEDVIKFYIEKFTNPEVVDDVMAMLQAGASVKAVVEGTYTQGVMKGMHTLDAGMLAAPTLSLFLQALASEIGVDVIVDRKDPKRRAERKEKDRFLALVKKYMDDNPEKDEGTELLESMTNSMSEDMPDEPVAEEAPMEEEVNTEEAPSMGLMARGV